MKLPSSILAAPRLDAPERDSAEAGWRQAPPSQPHGAVTLGSTRWRIACAGGIALVLFMPMLVGQRAFFWDWMNHLWLIAMQAEYVRAHFVPTFFLNTTDLGYFYPFFAFYGGTLYYFTGLIAVVVHSTWTAYVGSYVLGLAAAFYGWNWLSRQASISGWTALLPGTVFVCGPYYLTNAYGRGAWPEFIAVSAIPLALAASWSLLTNSHAPARDFLALCISIVVLTGSHTITLLYGSLFTLIALAGAAAYRRCRGLKIQRMRLCALAWALGAGVNAWFLVPLVHYRGEVVAQPGGLGFREFDQWDVLFSLVPVNPWANSTPQLYVQAPMVPLVVAAGVLGLGVFLLRSRGMLALAALAALPVVVLLAVLLDILPIWSVLPIEAQVIQFPYRLNSYVLLGIAGLMLAALICARALRAAQPRMSAAMLSVLAASTLVQLALGNVQVWTAMTYGSAADRLASFSLDHTPDGWYDPGVYFSRVVPQLPSADLDLPIADQDQVLTTGTLELPATAEPLTVGTRIVPSSLISLQPDLLVGQVAGHAALQDPGSSAPVTVVVAPRLSPWTLGGAVVTIISLAGIVSALMCTSGLVRRLWKGARGTLVCGSL